MILIIGAGALGSHVALLLRNVAPLKVVDFDRVEQKNTLAQFHMRTTMGRNKALALSQSLQAMFGVKVEGIPHRFADENAKVLLEGAKLVIDCTDNLEARRVIQRGAEKAGVPCLHGALTADGTFARILWGSLFQGDDEGHDGAATCVDGEHLPFFALVASLMAGEAQRFLKTGRQSSYQVTPAFITRLV